MKKKKRTTEHEDRLYQKAWLLFILFTGDCLDSMLIA